MPEPICTLTGHTCGTDTVRKGETCPDRANGFRCRYDGPDRVLIVTGPTFTSPPTHDLREATYEDLQRACLQTELENRRLKSELARLTGERDEARGEAERLRFELETVGTENDELEQEAEETFAGLQVVIAARDAAEAELATLKAAAALKPC